MSGPRVFNSNGNHNHNKPYYYHFKRKKSIKTTNSSYAYPSSSRNHRKALWLPWPASASPPLETVGSSNSNTTTKPFFRENPTHNRKSSSKEDISSTILWMVSVPDPVVDNNTHPPEAELPFRNYRNSPELPASSRPAPTVSSSARSQPPLIANPPSQPLIIPSHVAHALLLTR